MAIIQAPGGTGQLTQNLLNLLATEKQMELQERQTEIEERRQKLTEEQAAAEQQAGAALLQNQIASDPRVAQAVAQQFPQTMTPGSEAVQSPLGGQIQQPTMPEQPSAQQVPPAAAAQLAQGFQQQRATEAQIALTESERGKVEAQTELTQAKTELEERLMGIREELARANVALTEAQTDEARATAEAQREGASLRLAEIASDLVAQEQEIFARTFATLSQSLNEDQRADASAVASFVAFGTPNRPDLGERADQIATNLRGIADQNPDLLSMGLTDFETRTAQALGIGPGTQVHYQRLASTMDAQDALDQAIEDIERVRGQESDSIIESQKAAAEMFFEAVTGEDLTVTEIEDREGVFNTLRRQIQFRMEQAEGEQFVPSSGITPG